MEVTVAKPWNLLNYVHVIYHGLVLFLTLYIVGIPLRDYRHLHSWHAVLGTISFLTLATEAVTVFSEDVWYFTGTSKKEKIQIHGILMGITTLFAISSLGFEYYRKVKKKRTFHFSTPHGILALSATISLVIVFFTGVIVANPEWSPNWMKTIHNVFGQISYFLGITCICFSYFYNWTEERERLFLPSLDLRVLITFLTIFLIIWSLAHPIKSLVKHL